MGRDYCEAFHGEGKKETEVEIIKGQIKEMPLKER